MDPRLRAPVLALPALPAAADVPALHRRAAALARHSGTLVVDLDGFGDEGLAAVDLLARLALTARRQGCAVRLRGASPGLVSLLGLLGLGETFSR